MPSPISSAVVIARLLDCEGFTDYLANQIERYWRRNIAVSPEEQKEIEKLERGVAELSIGLSEKQRKTLGKFVGLHKKMSFDVGLRIGLTAFAQKQNGALGTAHETDQSHKPALEATKKEELVGRVEEK